MKETAPSFEQVLEAALRRVLDERLAPLEAAVRGLTTAPAPTRKLKVREVSELSNRHPDTVRRAIADGHLRAHKPKGSREWLVDPADARAWAEASPTQEAVDFDAEVGKAVARARGGASR